MKQHLTILNRSKILWALVLPLSGCNALFGEEVARLTVNAVSTAGHEVVKEASLQLKKDDEIALWSDMDMAYTGACPVRFQVLVTKNGAPFQQLELDPTQKNLTVGEVKTTVNDKVNWSFTGKNHALKIAENGTYTFKARLVADANPSLKLTKAELVLKK